MTVLGEEWKYSHLASSGTALTGTFNSVFSAGTHSIAAKNGDGIYYSSDSGVTWTKATSTTSTFATDTFNSVYLLADGHAIAGTSHVSGASLSGIYYSTDFGVTWTLAGGLDFPIQSLSMLADGHGIAGSSLDGSHGNGILYTSILYGSIWYLSTCSDIIFATAVFNSVSMISDGHAIAGSTSHGIYYTSGANYGTEWTASSVTTGSFSSVALVGVKAIAVSSSGNGIYSSSDSGATWSQRVSNGSFSSVFFLSDGLHAIAGSSTDAGILYSTDGGVSWNTGAVKTTDCCCYNNKVTTGSFGSVFMLSNGSAIAGSTSGSGIWYSCDYGLSWKISTQILSGFKSVFMVPEYAIAGSGFGGPLLYSNVYNPYNPCCNCCQKSCCCCETDYYSSRNHSQSPKLYTYSHSKKKSVEEDKDYKTHKHSKDKKSTFGKG